LYLARGRATGEASDFARAESLAAASLHTRQRRNREAARILVSALMAEHRFTEAREVMLPELASDPADPIARATLGEIALELGRYRDADGLFATLTMVRTRPEVAPRYARWLEINGKSGAARELLVATRQELQRGFRVPEEQLAWFDLRIGELAARNGRADLARQAFDRGLDLHPDDPRLLLAKARLAAHRKEWATAIQLGEQALSNTFDPATLALLTDSYAAQGDSAKAEEYARAMEVSVSRQPGAYHRGWALFLLDHGRRVEQVLAKAQAELTIRKDVYGYDVAAWALHRAGRDPEALALADSALSRGTRDAMLFHHRAMIRRALGDSSGAVKDLARAAEIDPSNSKSQ
jgi:tetratricopeptide (TPR) repeat protein